MIKLILVIIYIFIHPLSNVNSKEMTKFYNLDIDQNIELNILCDRDIKLGSLKLYLDDQIFTIDHNTFLQKKVINKTIQFKRDVNASEIYQIKNKFWFRFLAFFRYYFFDINNKVYLYYNDKHYKNEKVHSISLSIPKINIEDGSLINLKFKNQIKLQNISIYYSNSITHIARNSVDKHNIYNKDKETFFFFEVNKNILIMEKKLFNVPFFTLFYKDENIFKNIDFLLPLNISASQSINKKKDIYIPADNLLLITRIYYNKLKILILTEVPFDKKTLGRIFNRRLEKIYFRHQNENAKCNVL
jgi:hypothetical protein